MTASGGLDYAGALQILNDLSAEVAASQTRSLSAAQFNDLQTIVANLNNGIVTSEYVTSILTQLVDGSPANAIWTGGSRSSVTLGNLSTGASSAKLNELIGKWFLGTDLPNAVTQDQTTLKNIYPSYQTFNDPLYGASGAPAVADVAQGQTGDCELLSGIIDTVINHPANIPSMFVSDGNGVYGIRFYCGGKPIWVTVNNQLPVYNGELLYNYSTNLWASLIEKAYAQVSAAGITGQSLVNSYNNISADYPVNVLKNFTNTSSVQYFFSAASDWSGFKGLVVSALASKNDVILESNGDTYNSAGLQLLVSDHAFAVVGYDNATGDFIVRNPWGDFSSTQTYVAQFEVSMADIAGVSGDFVIDNSANPNILIASQGLLSTLGQTFAFSQFIASGQFVSVGSSTPLSTLFLATDLAGLPITEYMIQAIGSGTVQLNGATNLATSSQSSQGQIIVSAADLAKLTYVAASVTGSSDLLVSGYDGGGWSPGFDIALTVTAMRAAVSPVLNAAVAPAASLPVAGLFSASGLTGLTGVYYLLSVEGSAGSLNLNGAKNYTSHAGQIEVQASDLHSVTFTAPSSAPASNYDQVFIDVTVYQNQSAISDLIQLPVLVGANCATAVQNFNGGSIAFQIAIADTASSVFSSLDTVQSMVSAGDVSGILLTDGTTQHQTLSLAQFNADMGALSLLTGPVALTLTGETVAGALSQINQNHVTAVGLTDSAANIVAKLDSLQSLASAGALVSVALTDSGIPALSITSAQVGNDAVVLSEITGNFSVVQTVSGNNLTINGLSNALGNTAVFSGTASQYAIVAPGDGVSLTVGSDHLSNVQAIQFSDHTLIVAQTPGTATVTSGNVTELYGAVFGRLPDVAGLSYYTKELLANPSLPLTLFAQDFLASPEYISNTAHNYAQTTAGDTQFIADAYNNLLRRAPGPTDAAWYIANVITPFLSGKTPGTDAYSAAESLAHAYVITDFSASQEFLNDVQVTAANPPSAQHWLLLI